MFTRYKWIIAALVICTLCIAGRVWFANYRSVRRFTISKVLGGGGLENGRNVEMLIGANDNGEFLAVLVSESLIPTAKSDNWATARSKFKIVTGNDDKSGVWVDGRRLKVGEELIVQYTSPKFRATPVSIPAEHRDELVDDFYQKASALEFVDTWIVPRLPEKDE